MKIHLLSEQEAQSRALEIPDNSITINSQEELQAFQARQRIQQMQKPKMTQKQSRREKIEEIKETQERARILSSYQVGYCENCEGKRTFATLREGQIKFCSFCGNILVNTKRIEGLS